MRGVSAALFMAIAVLAGAATMSAQGARGAKGAPKNPVKPSAASVKEGLVAYAKNCRHCHGLKGLGDGPLAPKNPKPANLTDAKWDFGASDGEIFNIIWNGVPKPKSEMKGMKGTLAERDVWNIVNYLRTIGPKTAAK
jgi:mono/diheme cytochrome c family protein